MNYLGNDTGVSNGGSPGDSPGENSSDPSKAPPSKATLSKTPAPHPPLRAFDRDTRQSLIRLGATSTPPLALKSNTPFPELCAALERVPSEERRDFALHLIASALDVPALKAYTLDKLPFVLRHTSVAEKGDLVRHLFETKAGRRRERFELAAEVFRACADFRELRDLHRNIGPQFIRRTKSAQMLDILARFEYIESLRNRHIAPPLRATAKLAESHNRLADLKETLHEARRIVAADKLLARTPRGRQFANIINHNLRLLRREMDDIETAAEAREVANSIAAKMKLEFRYGVAITVREERGEPLVNLWSTDELAEIGRTLKRVPESLVLLSKHLGTIRKATIPDLANVGENVCGLWTESDGTIELREGLHHDADLAKSYGGKSGLGVILTHELGHVYESDRGYDIHQAKLEDGRKPPLFLSTEYRDISGWSIVDPTKYRIRHGGKAAIIEGASYRLEHDVAKIDGRDVFLIYDADNRTMFSHPVRAEWSLDDYSRANPSEDFAVSFSEYFRLPKQLAEFAPSKFLLLERHFGTYAADGEINAAATRSRSSRDRSNQGTSRALAPVVVRNTAFESFMIERFDQMTRGEQAWLLANLRFQKEERTDRSQIFALYRTYKDVLPLFRRTQFLQFVGQPERYAAVGDIMGDIMIQYKPANLALLAARLRGAEIGVLTLRSSRDGNNAHIDAIARFTGYSFEQRNLYFISDEKLNARIRHVNGGPAKKSHILGDFAAGHYSDQNGERRAMRRAYKRVVFYEDESRNLDAARRKAAEFPDGRLVVIDAKKPDAASIWSGICRRLLEGNVRSPNSAREIVFFDLDGTMFEVDATINIINRDSGVILRRLGQREYGSKPESAWIDEMVAADPTIDRHAIAFDFDDFKQPERIARQINFPRHLRDPNFKSTRERNRYRRTGRSAE
jgi:hypothetical protein